MTVAMTKSFTERSQILRDVLLILALTACVIGISAHAPSQTYLHAQLQQIGAVVGMIESGDWLLPRDQGGGLARKPQLYAWLDAPVLMATGIYNDFTFRLPTVIASLVASVLVYFLAMRWYGRRVGLLAACLWIIPHHMGKATYVAVTDMMLTMWMIASVLCADRLLFHPAPAKAQRKWAVGLWATIILAAMTKGWGVLNLILLGGMLAMATAFRPGFAELAGLGSLHRKLARAISLVVQRWWAAIRATRLGWGLLAMAAVLGPLWIGMFVTGGEEFRQIVQYEFWARITGQGPAVPHSSSVPPIVHLVYYLLPTSVFALAAMVLVRPKRWFLQGSAIAIPLCWILAVVIPFSLTHGFRHDYLIPCYPAAAMMGAWAIDTVATRGRQGGKAISFLRHVFAGVGICVSLCLIVVSPLYLFHDWLPEVLGGNIAMPPIVAPQTWWILAMLIPLGIVALAATIRASLRWRVRMVATIVIVAMLGVIFIERHAIARQARTGDGEKMLRFAREARRIVGRDEFAVARARKLATELYLGRFGLNLAGPLALRQGYVSEDEYRSVRLPGDNDGVRRAWLAMELLRRSEIGWLITCDRGLIEMGLAERTADGPVKMKVGRQSVRFRPTPEKLGAVEAVGQAVVSQRWGRAYLIRLAPEKIQALCEAKAYLRAVPVAFQSGRQDKEED